MTICLAIRAVPVLSYEPRPEHPIFGPLPTSIDIGWRHCDELIAGAHQAETQSRTEYLAQQHRLPADPEDVLSGIARDGATSRMWVAQSDSVRGYGMCPRKSVSIDPKTQYSILELPMLITETISGWNVRIRYLEVLFQNVKPCCRQVVPFVFVRLLH